MKRNQNWITEQFVRQYRLSAEMRWAHWIRAIAILALVVTGFYLARPYLTPEPVLEPVKFQYAMWRFVHIVCGFALAGITIFRIYVFFFDLRSRRAEWTSFYTTFKPKTWWQQLKYYALLSDSTIAKEGIYGPLQHVSYIMLMLMLIGEILTGFILHSAGYGQGLGGLLGEFLAPLTVWMGGLAGVRNIHYLLMWGILIFIPIHIYMVFWYSNRHPSGSVDAIFNGYVFKKVDDKKTMQ
ncbi:Ni/Fe-hydrogenase, b-type cytochrome subunit [Chrysiogenes arsenatis]|uniref:Ni/Fe-hydrogenase, b-type cytochrome subunit n=1 Tax=Chrysiogenes arsenatis TaxID=309797 RepID=UPI0004222E6D|nr:Ni/Fe-hydrogenase, b-type cytochrome subunit [Chrysiogenes arsenatis]